MKKYGQRAIIVPDDLWKESMSKASDHNLSLSAVIRILLAAWLAGKVRLWE